MATATLATPPAELNAAIEKAANLYHVPADILAGIWRVESASTFPNPAKNSKGYGGLFGTTLWNGSTQAQADLAASILANLLRKNGGDIQTALYQYSGGGYNSVPGQTTAGKWDPGQATGAQSQDSTVPGSISSGNEGAVATAVSGAVGAVGSGIGDAVHAVTGWTGALGSVLNTILGFFGRLPGYLIRGGLLVGGAVLVVLGFALLGKQALTA